MTEAGGVSATAPLLSIEELAPLVARWASLHGLPLATAAALTRRALERESDALLAFGADAALELERTGDPTAFLRVALEEHRDAAAIVAPTGARTAASNVVRTRRLAWRSASRRAGQVVAALVIVFLVFVGYGAFVDNRWYKVVSVEGASMEPTIDEGDAIVLRPPPAQVEEGMILTLEVEGRIVTHRVVEVRDDGTFVTKGDANAAADDFTGLDVRIVGRYWMRLPELGRFLSL
jgi:signal peptidase I